MRVVEFPETGEVVARIDLESFKEQGLLAYALRMAYEHTVSMNIRLELAAFYREIQPRGLPLA